MTLRIAGGRHRGRVLDSPQGDTIRPTGIRAREAIFDILLHGAPAQLVPVAGAVVLDAFAGTGAMGLEALSRGAARATFIEKDRAAVAALRANIARLGEDARAHVLQGDAARPPPSSGAADLAFLDPPYAAGLAGQALAALASAGWLAPRAVAVVETAARDAFAPPAGFREIDRRRYGKAAVSFLVRS